MNKYIRNIQIPSGEEYIIDGTSGKITNCVIEQNENINSTTVQPPAVKVRVKTRYA